MFASSFCDSSVFNYKTLVLLPCLGFVLFGWLSVVYFVFPACTLSSHLFFLSIYVCGGRKAIILLYVVISVPPDVDIFEEDIYAHVGERVIATCLIQGSPLKDFYWKFEDKKLESNYKYMVYMIILVL